MIKKSKVYSDRTSKVTTEETSDGTSDELSNVKITKTLHTFHHFK